MSEYKALLLERDELDKQIAAARERELGAAMEEVRAIVLDYALTHDDVFCRPRRSEAGVKVAAKYRDPQTGATWSGRGRAPAWVGSDRESFLIG